MNNDKVLRFWDKYINKTKTYGIKPTHACWYVLHAESYIKAYDGLRLYEHTAQHVIDYLDDMSRQSQLQSWQFQQIIKVLTNSLYRHR